MGAPLPTILEEDKPAHNHEICAIYKRFKITPNKYTLHNLLVDEYGLNKLSPKTFNAIFNNLSNMRKIKVLNEVDKILEIVSKSRACMPKSNTDKHNIITIKIL